MQRFVVVVSVLGFALACADPFAPILVEDGPTEVEVPAEVPAEGDAPAAGELAPRALVEQKEAGCGFTHTGPDGKIWFVEEIGGGSLAANVEGKDVLLNPTEPSAEAKKKVEGKPKVELAGYSDDTMHIDVMRKGETGRIDVSIGEGTVEIETKVKTNECM
jgi:hypothetical protein